MKSYPRAAAAAALAICTLPGAVLAHPGHDLAGMHAGFWHPLLGADHLLALLAAGLWAAQAGGRRRVWAPLSFLLALAGGFGLALAGFALPGVEPGLAASVVVLGLLLAGAAGLPAAASAALVGVFAVLHGNAHGVELPAHGAALAYGAGLLASSAMVLGAAVGMGAVLRHGAPRCLRAMGAGIAVGGALICAGL